MKAILILSIVVAMSVGLSSVAAQSNAAQSDFHRRARVKALRPAADTEVVADEIFLASDGEGRTRLMMTGPLPKEGRQRLFWVVDRTTGEYHLLKLTKDLAKDAQRIARIYRRLGVDIPAEHIALNLLPETQELKDRLLQLEREQGARLTQQARLDVLRDDVLNQATWIRPVARQESRAIVRNSFASEECSGADEVSRLRSLPVANTNANYRFGVRPAQWVQICAGSAWADVRTWELARFLFPVDHLNETYAQASWFATEGWLNSVSASRSCWADSTTFIGTHWSIEGCYESGTLGANYFDYAGTGYYINTDFIRLYLSCSTCQGTVGIASTAAVQYVNGGPNWGADYWEHYSGAAQFLPGWLLSGIIDGGGSQNCNYFCFPEQWQIDECVAQSTPEFEFWWDFATCSCVSNGTPIIIDLESDGLALTNPTNGVMFDLLANGQPVQTAWTQPGGDDAFLVLDRNGNGLIDDGSELFGGVTLQPGVTAAKKRRSDQSQPNGFLALSVFDDSANGGNNDGLITEDDAVWQSLKLWRDANHTGISEPTELISLTDAGIRSISLRYVSSKTTDEFGNVLRFSSYVVTERDMVDHRPMIRRAVDVLLLFFPHASSTAPAPDTGGTSRRFKAAE